MPILGGISTRPSPFSRNINSSAAMISLIVRPTAATSARERYSSFSPSCGFTKFSLVRVVAQFGCHPQPPSFGERGIWASRAAHRAFGLLPYWNCTTSLLCRLLRTTLQAQWQAYSRSTPLVPATFSQLLRFIQHLLNAASLGLGTAVAEDSKKMPAPFRRRHVLPSIPRHRVSREGNFQHGRKVLFRFHGGEQTLGNLIGTAHAGLRALGLRDPFCDLRAH